MAQDARALTRPRIPGLSRLPPELPRRLPFCALAVVLCYQFHWMALRFVTSEATLRFVTWLGYAGERLSAHQIAWNGQVFEYGIACTFADVFCGALPLLWVRRAGVLRNAEFVVAFAAGLFAFNLFRQAVTDLLFGAGVPWSLADNVIGGLSYFAVWVFLVRWLERGSPSTPAIAATPSVATP